jgi:hypothetical protein
MNKTDESVKDQPQKKPDDKGIVQVDTFVKIFDPETKEIYVEQRS